MAGSSPWKPKKVSLGRSLSYQRLAMMEATASQQEETGPENKSRVCSFLLREYLPPCSLFCIDTDNSAIMSAAMTSRRVAEMGMPSQCGPAWAWSERACQQVCS